MRRFILAGGVALLATLALAASATAASEARDPRVPALQRQVAALNSQVKTLQQNLVAVAATEACDNTWQTALTITLSDLVFAIIDEPPYSGTWPSSNGACAAIGRSDPTQPSGLRDLRALHGAALPGAGLGSFKPNSPFESYVFLMSALLGARR